MTIETDHSTPRQYAEGVSPLTQVREYPMSEHTPGPWEQGDEEFDAAGSWVAIDGPEGEDIAFVRCEEGDQSNANLIAAAPDLLEALEQIATGRITGEAEHSADTSKVRARIAQEALTKARGENHD